MSSVKLRCLDDSNNNIFVVDSVTGVSSTNTTESSNSTTGGLVLYGGLSINQTSNVSSATRGGAVSIAGGVAIAKDLYVGGNIISNNLGSTTASASFGQVSVFGTQDSINYTTGSLITIGGITVSVSTNAASLTNGGALLVAGGASIGRDVYIGGNLTVLGNQTSVVSQTLNIGDNLIVVNSGPSSSRDAGVLIQRFQTDNNSGNGDVVNDTATFSTTFASATGTTAIFNTSASSSDNFYNGWYIRVTSGTGINQVRKITAYTGSSRTATISSTWTTSPSSGDSVSFYNRVYASQFYQKSTDRFALGFTSDDPGASTVTLSDYAAFAAGAVSIFSTTNSTGLGTGGALTVLGGAAVSNTLFVGGSVAALSDTNTLGNIFTSGGNVGIGTTSPSQRLEVNGGLRSSSQTTGSIRSVRSQTVILNGPSPIEGSFPYTDGNWGFLLRSPNATPGIADFQFQNFNAVPRFTITSSGNVGIGTTSPATTLDVNGSVRITSGNLIATGDSNTIGNLFTTGGNVGIGTTAPFSRLSITPTVLESKLTLWDNNSTTGHYGFGVSTNQLNYHVPVSSDRHVFYTGGKNGDGTELFRIMSNGSATLSANVNAERGLSVRNTNNGSSAITSLRIVNDTVNDTILFLNSSTRTADGGVNTCTMRNDAGSLRLQAAGGVSSIWISSSSGNVGINTTGPTYTLDVAGSFEVTGVSALINNSNTLGNLYTTGGYVGINIISPAYQLDVNGSTNINGDLDVTGSINGGGASSSTFAYLTLTATDDAINLTSGAMVTFGGVSIQAATDATSPTSGGALLTEGGAAIGKRLFVGDGIVSTNSNTIGGLIATSTGSVGIGTTSPQATLDVNGTISATNLMITNETVSNLRVTTLLSSGNVQSEVVTAGTLLATGTSHTLGNLFTNGGNIGVGTTSPTGRLGVVGAGGDGTIRIAPTSVNSESSIGFYSNSGFTAGSTNGDFWVIGQGSWGVGTRNFGFGGQGVGSVMTLTSHGNVGIGTASPTHQLNITRTQLIASTQGVGDNNVATITGGALNVSGDVVVSGTRGIHFIPFGLGPPTFTTRSLGTKLNLFPALNASNVDYAIGMEHANMWCSALDTLSGFKWYHGTTNTMSLASYGNLFINSTTNSTGVGTGGAVTIAGGTSIARDLYVGGTLTVAGQNLTIVSGNSTVGSYAGTGVYTMSNISIGRTMSNTNYKLIGTLRTTSTTNNVYTVSFSALTTTTFNANVLRMDSLFSGWSDPNLILSWQITP